MPYVNNVKNALDELLEYINSVKDLRTRFDEEFAEIYLVVIEEVQAKALKVYNACESRGRF